jgi:hypothetical protein
MWELIPGWKTLPPVDEDESPANGTPEAWWSDDGRIGYLGHWWNGELVEDRRMTWLESAGGGSGLAAIMLWAFMIGVAGMVVWAANALGAFSLLSRWTVTDWLLLAIVFLLYQIVRLLRSRNVRRVRR